MTDRKETSAVKQLLLQSTADGYGGAAVIARGMAEELRQGRLPAMTSEQALEILAEACEKMKKELPNGP